MVRPQLKPLEKAVSYIEDVVESGIDTNNGRVLAKLRNVLKQLEDTAEQARTEVVEPALDEKIAIGDSVADVHRVQQEQPTVADNAAALEMLEDAGADPAEVIRIYPKQFKAAVEGSASNPSEVIEYQECTYYRRQG